MLLWAMWATMVNMVKAALRYSLRWSSRRSRDFHAARWGPLAATKTPLHPIACRTSTLSAPQVTKPTSYCYCTSSRAPHLLRISIFQTTSSLHTPSPPLIPPPIHRGASFCALKLLRTIQSLVGYILPSHQFLHSIHFLFLKPILAFAPPSRNLTCTHLRCHHSSALDSLFILHLHLPCFHIICAPLPYPILLSNPLTVNHVDKQQPLRCHTLITITGYNLTRSKRQLL